MHIIARPGERVGTSIAIRGGQGDGKSIVFERLLSKILGDMLLRVANQNLITGNFNEALMGKLVTVLEEATFARDTRSFDRLKELITADQTVINPKFKAPINIENFSTARPHLQRSPFPAHQARGPALHGSRVVGGVARPDRQIRAARSTSGTTAGQRDLSTTP